MVSIDVRKDGYDETIDCGALGISGAGTPMFILHRTSAVARYGMTGYRHSCPATYPRICSLQGRRPAKAARGGADLRCIRCHNGSGANGDRRIRPALPEAEDTQIGIKPLWHVPGKGRAWVDFQNDVTVKDIKLAHQENMRPIEHLKRWTTLGMATDQGKTSNATALAIMSELTGKSIPDTGTTIFRPPYTPVSMAVLGGGDTGAHFRPRRLTPSHAWAEAHGAVFVEVGQWMRAQYFPQAGETHWRQSVDREVLATERASASAM